MALGYIPIDVSQRRVLCECLCRWLVLIDNHVAGLATVTRLVLYACLWLHQLCSSLCLLLLYSLVVLDLALVDSICWEMTQVVVSKAIISASSLVLL